MKPLPEPSFGQLRLNPPALGFCLLLALVPACNDTENKKVKGGRETASGRIEFVLAVLDRDSLMDAATVVEVVHDPVFHGIKRYWALPFRPLLHARFPEAGLDTTGKVWFVCTDGYTVGMETTDFLAHEPYLCLRDTEAPTGSDWLPADKAGEEKSLGPFYLVWPHAPANDSRFVWPYALEKIVFGHESPD